MRRQSAFTLIELMVGLAVVAVILVLAAPSFRDMILMQRLRGTSAQLVTDMQFARAEAVSRRTLLRISFRSNAAMNCYTIFTAPSNVTRCDCLLGAGVACPAGLTEVRTAEVPLSRSVKLAPPASQPNKAFAFDPTTGGIYTIPTDDASAPLNDFVVEAYIDNARKLHTVINRAGRPSVCAPALSTMPETACP
ncbi:MAG: GspH/FimT family pseudopilin [Rubrivivax sp.]|nr:GspH/FimT family pseudopilin [Rubrivivax sp.]